MYVPASKLELRLRAVLDTADSREAFPLLLRLAEQQAHRYVGEVRAAAYVQIHELDAKHAEEQAERLRRVLKGEVV